MRITNIESAIIIADEAHKLLSSGFELVKVDVVNPWDFLKALGPSYRRGWCFFYEKDGNYRGELLMRHDVDLHAGRYSVYICAEKNRQAVMNKFKNKLG